MLSSCQVEQSTDAFGTASGVIILVDFDHSGIVDNCISCHDNIIAEGKPADHIPAPDTCEMCHNTNDWDEIITAPASTISAPLFDRLILTN